MQYKKAVIAVTLLLAVGFFIRGVAGDYENSNFRLEGTYSGGTQTLDWFSFERDGSNEFRYYSCVTGSQTEDIGAFKKVSDGKYILSSSQLQDVELVCYKKFPNTAGFNILLNGTECTFVQTSSYPSQITSSGGIE